MGIPYFNKFINEHTSPPLFTPITLTKNDYVIIDGNYLCHHIFMNCNQCSLFAYDKYYEQILKILKIFKDKCQSIYFIFDGVYNKKYDTNYVYSFDDSVQQQRQIPLLFHLTMINILEKLKIPYKSAVEEADPLCAHMANELKAYVIGFDSDYYFYNINKGYIPLKYFDLNTLSGKLYCHTTLLNVYQGLTIKCLALFPIIMNSVGYKTNDQKVLKSYLTTNCQSENRKENKEEKDESRTCDNANRIQILTNITYLLQWLTNVQNQKNLDVKTIISKLINDKHSLLFQLFDTKKKQEQLIKSANMFSNPSDVNNLKEEYTNLIPDYLMESFFNGYLDSSISTLCIFGRYTSHYNQNLQHQNILLPICSKLFGKSSQESSNHHVQFIYKHTNSVNTIEVPPIYKIGYEEHNMRDVYRCLTYIFENSQTTEDELFNDNRIHQAHHLWLLIMRYWYCTETETKINKQNYLCSFILSYLTLNFLDRYDDKSVIKDVLPTKPFLQYSLESFDKLSKSRWQKIHSKILRIYWIKDDEWIKQIYYVEQIYKNILL
ncbi:unnamed protein product, partial [Didymodactylos carnosus]